MGDDGAASAQRNLTRVLRVQVGKALARELREEGERVLAAKRESRQRQQGEEGDDDVEPMRADAKLLNDLTRLIMQYSTNFAADLLAFANHAKRKTVRFDDVLLCARRSNALQARLKELAAGRQGSEKRSKRAMPVENNDTSGVDEEESSSAVASLSRAPGYEDHRKGFQSAGGMATSSSSAAARVRRGDPIMLSDSSDEDGLIGSDDNDDDQVGQRQRKGKPRHEREPKKRKQLPRSSKKSKKRGRVQRTVHSDDSDFD